MKSYFGYVRVSTTKQGEHGSSLQEQKSAIEAYASRNALPISAWFEEMETAAKQGRRMFGRMLIELDRGHAAGVIIHKIDRSARNLRDWAQLGELIDRGVEVHFAHESVDLQSRGGRLSADIQAVVAADYVRNLRQEVKKGFYGRLKQGLYPLQAPIGYENNGGGKPKTIHLTNGPLVRELFELYASGQYGIEPLRQEMYRRGLRSSVGRPLSVNVVATLLHNPFYIGLIRTKRTPGIYQGIHEPLVPKSLFDRVQARMSGRAFPHIVQHGFTFRRVIKCARCAQSLVGERQSGRVYYRCHSPTCRGTSLREDAICTALQSQLDMLALDPEELRDLRDFGDELRAKQNQDVIHGRAAQKRALGHCEDRLNRLTDAFLDGDLDRDAFHSRNALLLQERAGLREALNAPEIATPAASVIRDLETGNRAQISAAPGFSALTRQTLELVTSKISARGKELEIELRFPFSAVLDARVLLSGGPTRGRLRKHLSSSSVVEALKKLLVQAAEHDIA